MALGHALKRYFTIGIRKLDRLADAHYQATLVKAGDVRRSTLTRLSDPSQLLPNMRLHIFRNY
jgi:hypothetical protein